MIENLRKYTGLSIALFAIAALAFIFGDYSRSTQSMTGGTSVLRIAGRTYTDKEMNTLGTQALSLTGSIARSGDYGLYQFLMGMSAGSTNQEQMPERFFISRMIIRDAKAEFGVYPGEEEISTYLRSLRVFAGTDGKFSPENFSNFVDKYLGRLGMTEKDLRELASDVLATKKINSIIGGGLSMDRATIAKSLAIDNQQVTGELAKLDIATFEEKIQPTEEEIKAHWESRKDTFTTEPRRKFTYMVVTPKFPEEPIAEDAPESIADMTATEEAKKAAQKAKDDAKAKRNADHAEARRKAQLETDSLVDDFLFNLETQKGTGFDELAKANNWEIKTSDFFSQKSPIKEIDFTIRATSQGGKVVDSLFRIKDTGDAFSKFSEAIPVGENQWFIARLDGQEASRAKTYEEAKAEARDQFINEKATAAMKASATESITKLKASLANGKSFADAAKEAGIHETKPFTAITKTSTPDAATQPQNLFELAHTLDPNTIADVIIQADRAFILYVAKREVVKEANADTRLDSEMSSITSGNESNAFSSWLAARTQAAKVEQLTKR
jgi:SurA N-terminal domain